MNGARLDTRRFIDGFLEARVPGASPFSISGGPDEPDKAVITETAISHKNMGTGKKYVHCLLSCRRWAAADGRYVRTDNAPPNRKDRHSYKGY